MNRRTSYLLILLMAVATTAGCTKNRSPLDGGSTARYKPTITQGVWGRVTLWKGDFMPFNSPKPTGTVTPVIRQVVVFQRAQFQRDADGSFTWFRSVNTPKVASTWTDENGWYQLDLPPGQYSILVREPTARIPDTIKAKAWGSELYYANGGDSNGYINPVTITAGKSVESNVSLTYLATF